MAAGGKESNIINDALFSSKTDQWATPTDFFEKINKEFHFDLDPCADESNHKCEEYFTKEQNGLIQKWGGSLCILQSSVWQRDIQMGS